MARGRDVGDPGRVKNREFEGRAHLAGEIEMRRGRHALHRDHVGQRGVGVDVAADDVEEVDLAGRDQAARDLEPDLAGDAVFHLLVDDQAQADDEFGADARANRIEDEMGEAQAIVE